jgi:hypothetical protein
MQTKSLAAIINPAQAACKQWVDVVIPNPGARFLPPTGDAHLVPRGSPPNEEPIVCPAVRGHIRGQGTVYHICTLINPGDFDVIQITPSSHEYEFHASPWVADDWKDLVPDLKARLGTTVFESEPPTTTVVDYSPVLKIVKLQRRIPSLMLTLDIWAYVYWMQDMVPVEIRLQCGDPTHEGALTLEADEVWLESGEYLHLDYRHKKGLPVPEQLGTEGKLRWRQVLLQTGDALGRAQQVSHRGALLCLPNSQKLGDIIRQGINVDAGIAERWQWLQCRMNAPILGVSTQWPEGNWLAFGRTPEVPENSKADGGWGEATNRLRHFIEGLQHQGHIGDTRTHGLTKTPGAQGGQEDFGNTKGSMCATVGHPASLFEMAYDVEGWAMRYCHNREADGSVVQADNHPGTKFWSGTPHPVHSTDMLGWPRTKPWSWPHLGWHPMDDQHYSVNLLCAFQQLTLSFAVDQDIDHLLEVDLMSVPERTGAVRGVGRRLIGWANIHKSGTENQQQIAWDLAHELLENDVKRDADLYEHLDDPIRVVVAEDIAKYGWYQADGITHQIGWVVWGEAFAACGAYAWWKITSDVDWQTLAAAISETITRYGVFKTGTTWQMCYAVRSVLDASGDHTGQPIPPEQYVVERNPNCWVENMFWSWTIAAIQILEDLRPDVVDDLSRRADDILRTMIGATPGNWPHAEWLSPRPLS